MVEDSLPCTIVCLFFLFTPMHQLYNVLIIEWTGMQCVFFLIVSFEIDQNCLKLLLINKEDHGGASVSLPFRCFVCWLEVKL